MRLWVGFGLLIVGFGVDLGFDIRERDLFSWMDPYQYYEFARGVWEGREAFDQFEIPSLFPFAVIPLLAVQPSIPGALGIGFASMLLLLGALHPLCRELSLKTPSPLVALLVLSSPLLIGLSRTLYVEFTLTALATATFLFWLRLLRTPDPRSALAFGLALGAGFLIKTTFPLFFAPPVAGAMLGRLVDRRFDDAALMLAAAVVPIAFGMLIHGSVFSPSLGYYLNLASTALPFMYLMGPPEVLSWSSATYYLEQIGRSFLFLLTPLLAFAVLASARHWKDWLDPAGPRAALWLWLIGPLLLLVVHPLKEPRHAAPCVVPAVLLLVLGIEALPKRVARVGLTVAVLLALGQYAAVTSHRVETPYFLDRSLHYQEIRDRMLEADARAYRRTPPDLRMPHWRYNQNVAIAGFPANEALALTWQGFPGVVFDLDSFDDARRFSDEIPFRQFEDLFFLAGVNTYNRRCGWHGYYRTLSRGAVVANADFLILNDVDASMLPGRFPGHDRVATLERQGGSVHVLRSRGPTTPFRTLYARAFLERNPELGDDETRVILRELLMVAALEGDAAQVRALLREFPILGEREQTVRNIYWIGGYPALIDWARQVMERMLRRGGQVGPEPSALPGPR
jgi:hypothetical protein